MSIAKFNSNQKKEFNNNVNYKIQYQTQKFNFII